MDGCLADRRTSTALYVSVVNFVDLASQRCRNNVDSYRRFFWTGFLLNPFKVNPLKLFRRGSESTLTAANRSIRTTTLQSVGSYVRRRLWVWPIIAVLILSIIGFGVRSAVESTMKRSLTSELNTLLSVETAMLETWLQVQASNVNSMASDRQIRESIYAVLQHEDEQLTPASNDAAAIALMHKTLAKELAPGLSSHDYSGFFVANKSGRIVASSFKSLIGREDTPEFSDFLERCLSGQTIVSPPFRGVVLQKSDNGETRMGEPSMYVSAPIRDVDFQVVGTLSLKIQPEREFTRILQLGRKGDSGETYAVNRDGTMVSNSRFDEDLILLGLLPDEPNSRSILNIQVRDPGGNVTEGFRPTVRRSMLPLTRMAKDAIEGRSGSDVEGYNDYRGVPVVGAWTWLPDFRVGVATEVDYEEAFRPLTILQRTFWTLYLLLVISSIAILIFTIAVSRLQREAQAAAMEAQQLGQYTLEKRIGAGAMGVVYRGNHSMLCRPTAIKMLNLENVNEAAIARFEREVQITSGLNHPNTIAIYDYGRTPEGVFYYAMEYLDGIDLQSLVEKYGPQSEDRVVHILNQICGSLFEAHSEGLVHRDIKPANIILNRRGCEPDVVKVLDFGLVKALDDDSDQGSNSLTGTPLYMSPEAIQTPMSVDARSDLYAVGAVGYYLLTGKPVFEAESIVELCQKHVDESPLTPSDQLGKPVSSELESTLMSCLEKSRARRPQTARDLSKLISRSPSASNWSIEDFDGWWGHHERGLPPDDVKTVENTTNPGAFDRTIIGDN